MMKKPWQIWSLFGLILAVVLPAMVWLTWQINRVDHVREQDRVETELARQEAELQERINSALYRMDWWATPLVAQEAARPYFMYEPFYRVSTANSSWNFVQGGQSLQSEKLLPGTGETEHPSPLLYESSEYVVMHFQVYPNDQISSPQVSDMAVSCGVPESQILDNDVNLNRAADFCRYQEVVLKCQELPPVSDLVPSGQNVDFQTVYHDPGFNRFSNPYQTEELRNAQLANSATTQETKSKLQVARSENRGNTEFAQRAQTAELNARSQWVSNQICDLVPTKTGLVREGVMRPLWIGDNLVLARRVEGENKKLVQCCWLDWEKIREKLKQEVADLLPEVEFEPVKQQQDLIFSRAMATLPIQLVVNSEKLLATLALDSPPQIAASPSGLKMSLWVAWIGLGLAAVASALLLKGVLQLSERRAAFVSAVTHELRTPLTTFRMYSEMLAEKMVPPENQHEYAETMKVEADRLSNLVENVLQFARLERETSEGRMESVPLADLLVRFEDRLQRRAGNADMNLTIKHSQSKETVRTDPSKVEQVVFNLVDNACKYACGSEHREIEVGIKTVGGKVSIWVQDEGPGVAPKFRRRLFKPFCKSDQDSADTASGVGLGLALCQRMARSLGGRVYLAPSDNGSRFIFEFPLA